MMICLTTKLSVEEKDRVPFLEAARYVAEQTRLIRGCNRFLIFQDLEERNDFILVEEWDSRGELQKHMRSANFRNMLAILELASRQPEIQLSSFDDSSGTDLLEKMVHAP